MLIARAMSGIGPGAMWDDEDGFYYDVLRLPDGNTTRLKVRVGLLPLCATTAIDKFQRERVPRLTEQMYDRDFAYSGDNFKIECPIGSRKLMNFFEVARDR